MILNGNARLSSEMQDLSEERRAPHTAGMSEHHDDLQEMKAELERITSQAPAPARGDQAEAALAHTRQLRDQAANITVEARRIVDAKKADIERQMAELDKMRRAMEAELEPMLEKVTGLNRAHEAMTLYLGMREQFTTIRADGEPAPAGTPLTIFQAVLAMDEESKLAAASGGMSFMSIDNFDAWLLDHPDHLAQIAPAPLSIVALIARRADMSTGDPFTDEYVRKRNNQPWFLVRNGDRLYRFSAEDVEIGEHLIPSPERFARFFQDRNGNQLTPGTKAWEDAAELAGAAQRHAMRIGLIVQGTIDRTDFLSPAIEQGGLNLLDPNGFRDPRARLVLDSDLALEDGRPSWAQFLRGASASIAVGSRIVGDFDSYNFHENSNHPDALHRSTPRHKGPPESMVPHTILRADHRRENGGFVFPFKPWSYRTGSYDPDSRSATWFIHPFDKNIIPIDAVSEADLRYYATSRTQARHYLDSIPVIQAALEVKRSEREAQHAFFEEAARRAGAELGVDAETLLSRAEVQLGQWRTATKWTKPVIDLTEPKAVTAMAWVVKHLVLEVQGADRDAETLEKIRAAHPDSVAVYRRSNGRVVVLCPEVSKYPNTVLDRHFLRVLDYSAARLKCTSDDRWQLVAKASLAQARLLWSDPEWMKWSFVTSERPRDLATDEDIESAAAELLEQVAGEHELWRLAAARHDGRSVKVFALFLDRDDTAQVHAASLVVDPERRKEPARLRALSKITGAWSPWSEDTLCFPSVEIGYGPYGMDMRNVEKLDVIREATETAHRLIGLEAELRRASDEKREHQSWWSTVITPLADAAEKAELAAASEEFAERYGGDERLWPRNGKATVKARGSNASSDLRRALGTAPDERFDATGKTAAELFPNKLDHIPVELHQFVPVPSE